MVAALERGNIDAFAVWEPWPTRAMRAIPGTRILLSNDAIQIQSNFVYMNKAWAEANAEATTRFLRSMVEAQEFIAAQPAQAAAHVGRFLRQDAAFMAELMTKLEFRMNLGPDSQAHMQVAIDQLRGMNRLPREVTPAQLLWSEPLARVAAGRVRLAFEVRQVTGPLLVHFTAVARRRSGLMREVRAVRGPAPPPAPRLAVTEGAAPPPGDLEPARRLQQPALHHGRRTRGAGGEAAGAGAG